MTDLLQGDEPNSKRTIHEQIAAQLEREGIRVEEARFFDGGIDLWEDVTGDWTDAELAVLAEKLQEKTVKYCNTFIPDLYGYLCNVRDNMRSDDEEENGNDDEGI